MIKLFMEKLTNIYIYIWLRQNNIQERGLFTNKQQSLFERLEGVFSLSRKHSYPIMGCKYGY